MIWNNLGYDFLSNNLLRQANETFKINTFLYPNSDNVYNAMQKLCKKQAKEEAIMMFKKSLQVNPDNMDSQKSLSALGAE